MKLYHHPVSTYSQKALVAFYEKGLPFTPAIVNMMDPAARAEYAKVSPTGKIPLLVLDDGRKIVEASIIIEHLDAHHPASGTKLIPADIDAAIEARYLDRVFDLYLNDQIATIFIDGLQPPDQRNPAGVASARAVLDRTYALLDERLAGRTWAAGDSFSLADCAAAPALSYARMIHPFQHKNLVAYANRLAERPSCARVRDEAAPILAAMQSR